MKMGRRPVVILGITAVLLVVAYVLWWPNVLQAVQGMHGPLGGGPGMHFR
jgi:hypothetical protein